MVKDLALKIGILVLFVLLIVLAVCWIHSFSLALNFAGLDSADVYEINALVDPEGMIHKFIQTTTKEGDFVLARVKRNTLGFWSVEEINTNKPFEEYSETPVISMVWAKRAGARRFNTQNAKLEIEYHVFYFGTDAIKFITIDQEQLPENTTINIHQAGERYWLHAISFPDEDGDVDLIGSIEYPIHEILENNGCVAPLK